MSQLYVIHLSLDKSNDVQNIIHEKMLKFDRPYSECQRQNMCDKNNICLFFKNFNIHVQKTIELISQHFHPQESFKIMFTFPKPNTRKNFELMKICTKIVDEIIEKYNNTQKHKRKREEQFELEKESIGRRLGQRKQSIGFQVHQRHKSSPRTFRASVKH